MSTLVGMRCMAFRLEHGDKVLVYSDAARIFLQLRHLTPTGASDQDVLTPSFKVALSLTEDAALALAADPSSLADEKLRLRARMRSLRNAVCSARGQCQIPAFCVSQDCVGLAP